MAVDSTVQFKRGKKNDLPYGLEGDLYTVQIQMNYMWVKVKTFHLN